MLMVREQFLKPDKWNPRGYYEDKKMKLYVKQAVAGVRSPESMATNVRSWMTQGKDISWGFKVTQLSNGPPELLEALDPRRIIVCMRDREMTGRSVVSWRRSKWDLDSVRALRKVDRMMSGLMKILHGRQVLWLDFSEQRDEADLKRLLEVYLLSGADASKPRSWAAV